MVHRYVIYEPMYITAAFYQRNFINSTYIFLCKQAEEERYRCHRVIRQSEQIRISRARSISIVIRMQENITHFHRQSCHHYLVPTPEKLLSVPKSRRERST